MTQGYRDYLIRKTRRNLRKVRIYMSEHKYLITGVAVMTLSVVLACTGIYKINTLADTQDIETIEIVPEVIELDIQKAYETEDVMQIIEEPEPTFEKTTLYVVTEKLNVRCGAGTEYDKLGALYIGSTVEAIDYINGWYVIDFGGTRGYISADYVTTENPFMQVESTAYWNQYNRPCADTSTPQANLTLAGKISWLGKSCYLFKCNADGTIGDCLGYYEFHDTGYGQESGEGNSVILSNRTVGTIENGSCIDIFMDTREECVQYGRQNVFILFVDEA
jgi:3D (Asp-Asp-Asp) domain-containing protein